MFAVTLNLDYFFIKSIYLIEFYRKEFVMNMFLSW